MIFYNATLATMTAGYGLVESAAIVTQGEQIIWAGAEADMPAAEGERVDLGGRLVTPGLLDCHTHVVYAGHRAHEFEMLLKGATYEEVSKSGGGIVSTVRATREASEDDLVSSSLPRVDQMLADGVTCIEIKSGYGLDVETELRMLRAARRLAALRPVRVQTTFLGAHALPVEYAGRHDDYITEQVLPALQVGHGEGLIDAVDGFCEGIAFSPHQIKRVFECALSLGLPVKLHAEQLANLGGAALAAEYHALSADHLEYLDEDGVKAMARSGTIAVILPAAFYTLRETKVPPIDLLRKYGVAMAVATDSNPGTAPMTSLLLAMNMACTFFRLTPEEALAGVTIHAATALGLDDCGRIDRGYRADFAVWDAIHPSELSYRIGATKLHTRIFGGQNDCGNP